MHTSGTGMGRDVRAVLVEIAQKSGDMTEDSAQKFVLNLQNSGRYVQELWS